jgi:hypothetical protein
MHKLTKPEKKTKRKRHPVQAAGSWKPRKKNGQRDAQPSTGDGKLETTKKKWPA